MNMFYVIVLIVLVFIFFIRPWIVKKGIVNKIALGARQISLQRLKNMIKENGIRREELYNEDGTVKESKARTKKSG